MCHPQRSAVRLPIDTADPESGQPLPLRVTDLRQYLYCPGIIFYHHVAPVERKVSFKMEEGRVAHATLDGLERRRTLARYRLDEGERSFHLTLFSERLGLSGVLDMAIDGPTGSFPVEFKWTEGEPMLGHKYQLAGYALLLEEARSRPVVTGFLALVPGRRLIEVPLTDSVRLHARRLLTRIRRVIARGALPEATAQRGRCVDCEFRNYCRDIGFGTQATFALGAISTAAGRQSGEARQRHDEDVGGGDLVLSQSRGTAIRHARPAAEVTGGGRGGGTAGMAVDGGTDPPAIRTEADPVGGGEQVLPHRP